MTTSIPNDSLAQPVQHESPARSKQKTPSWLKKLFNQTQEQHSPQETAHKVTTAPPSTSYPKTAEEKTALAGQFKVGDVVFTRFTTSISMNEPVDNLISFTQKAVNLVRRKRDKEDLHRITHAAIVVAVDVENGKVLVAEAMPTGKKNELRVIDLLADKSMQLGEKDPFEFEVFRMNNSENELATKAAEIAKSLATPAKYLESDNNNSEESKGLHKFSFLRGLIAIFSSGETSTKSKNYSKRLFKKVADEHLRTKLQRQRATGNSKDRQFFCSYFTSHVFQQAELSKKLDVIKKLDGVNTGLEEIAKIKDEKKRDREIRKWASNMAKQHGDAIKKEVTAFTLDPKLTSPQELIQFLKKDELFTPILRITPASQKRKSLRQDQI